MQTQPRRPTPTAFSGYVSESRFGLIMMAGALVLVVMLVAVYDRVGFMPIWATPTIAGVS